MNASGYRFDSFVVDFSAREFVRDGERIHLQEQPFQLLVTLLERSNQVVTREELRRKLWPANVLVDFDHRLNNAITRLREVLRDDADSPRFIETVPRVGYRFIHPLAAVPGSGVIAEQSSNGSVGPDLPLPAQASTPDVPLTPRTQEAHGKARIWLKFGACVMILAIAAAAVWQLRRHADAGHPLQSVIVLPFDDLSADKTQPYLPDSITDSLISDLGRLTPLRVISSSTAMHYRGMHPRPSRLADELAVDAVIEGNVVRAGQQLRVEVRLIRARDERRLWAQSFERDRTALGALMTDLAAGAGQVLAPTASTRHETTVSGSRSTIPAAYDAYLRGMHLLRNERNKETVDRSIAYFEAARALDPNFGPAYAGLSEAYGTERGSIIMNQRRIVEADPLPLVMARRAVELSPEVAQAWIALSSALADREDPKCLEASQKALDLAPADAWVHKQVADCYGALDNREKGLEHLRISLDLDPLNPYTLGVYGSTLIESGDAEKGLQCLRKAVQLDPQSFIPRFRLGVAYTELHRYSEGMAEFSAAEAISPDSLTSEVGLAWAEALAGETAKAEAMLPKLIAHAEALDYPSGVALIEVALHHRKEGLAWLARSVEENEKFFFDWPESPGSEWLQDDPEFQELARRMGVTYTGLGL
jgi:TolB-like protein/DNA-binding winged helix-turn-helix (wHTH) protein/cytochrome c-type biogenesis protein CcmH/NrfG